MATMTATSTATMAMAAINNQQFNSGYRVENVASGANENINNIIISHVNVSQPVKFKKTA